MNAVLSLPVGKSIVQHANQTQEGHTEGHMEGVRLEKHPGITHFGVFEDGYIPTQTFYCNVDGSLH